MSESILQIFLNNKFIKTSDAGNIDGLNKAVASVKANLTKKKPNIIPYCLVALDPQISETDPIVAEVESIIIKNWPGFKNSTSTKDKATTYVRVVILQALAQLAKDEQLAAIIWLTGRNVLSFYQTQKEREAMSELLVRMGNQFELGSRKYWSLNEPTIGDVKALSISVSATKTGGFNQEEMTNHLKAAAVHSGWAHQAGAGENPYSPAQNNVNWPNFFAERAAQGLTEVINSALTNQEKSITSIAGSIQKDVNTYFAQFQQFFSEVANSLNQSAVAVNKRGDLLWWKQTLYSPILNESYRHQTAVVAAMSMAYDLSHLVGLSHPESVNYLLREALRDVFLEAASTEETFLFWIENALKITGSSRQILTSLENANPGRKSLGSAFANVLATNDGSIFFTETGIDPNQKLSLSKLANWFFHDLMATKFATQK